MSKSGSSELSLASFTGKISMPLFLCALWSTKKGRLFFFLQVHRCGSISCSLLSIFSMLTLVLQLKSHPCVYFLLSFGP